MFSDDSVTIFYIQYEFWELLLAGLKNNCSLFKLPDLLKVYERLLSLSHRYQFCVYERIYLIKRPMITWPLWWNISIRVEYALNNNSLTRNHRWNRSDRQSRALQINDSFNIDVLNWTVWIQIDWYVEADFERGSLRSILSRQLFTYFTKRIHDDQ